MSEKWKKEHPDKVKEYRRKWYEANRDKAAISRAKWSNANRDKMARFRRKWNDAHPDKVTECNRNFRVKHPLYMRWSSMLRRTGVRKGASANEIKDYIGRGITVCEEWRTYANFEAWCFANGWKPELQLDRIDNDGNYEPSNCRFVTRSQNARNKRNTIFVVYNGIRMALADVYEETKCQIPIMTVKTRINRLKWPIEKALTVPVGSNERN
ncbi:MAG: hypothetical protein J6V72_11205 [Kiritimatiellae bacterium]|nr:hypothetical protein [Kiritimatiellia bacterium]